MAGLGEWDEDDETPPRRFERLDEWVDQWLVYALWLDVDTSERIWCPQWWQHLAAHMRLDAMHRSWEAARLEPASGMATWLRDVADVHMAYLMDPHGPFKGCSTRKGHQERSRVIPTEPAPASMFDPED